MVSVVLQESLVWHLEKGSSSIDACFKFCVCQELEYLKSESQF